MWQGAQRVFLLQKIRLRYEQVAGKQTGSQGYWVMFPLHTVYRELHLIPDKVNPCDMEPTDSFT